MPKFKILFTVKQEYEGTIEVEAEDAETARRAFDEGEYDDDRLEADLDLIDSKDTIETITLQSDSTKESGNYFDDGSTSY